ncbi:MAG: hypothetical protein M3094_08560, partial [Actinomycetia bacterium]|nr:hypothetical protein [Actinomycetes bacterium]
MIPLVAFIALAACTNTSAGGVDVESASKSEGDSALFCRGWAQARQTIIDTIAGEEGRLEWYESAESLDAAMAEYDRHAPPEIRGEWATAYDVYTKLSDIRFTTGGATRPEHYTMVFGTPDAEPALSNALAAIATIDEWSLTECGDFCSRWPTLQRLLASNPDSYAWGGDPNRIAQQLTSTRGAIQAGYVLVPDEIRAPWTTAADTAMGFLDMIDEYDGQLPGGEEREEALIDRIGVGQEQATEASDAAIGVIEDWASSNCDPALASGGAPGSIRVRYWPYEHLAGRTVFAALLPAGVPFESLTSADQYLGASCGEVSSSQEFDGAFAELEGQARESNLAVEDLIEEQWHWGDSLRPLRQIGEYYESICGRIRNEGELVLPGGQYDLFIGTYIGDPGGYGMYLAAPEYCAQVTISIDGDTTVDIPDLEKCDIPPRGDPE